LRLLEPALEKAVLANGPFICDQGLQEIDVREFIGCRFLQKDVEFCAAPESRMDLSR